MEIELYSKLNELAGPVERLGHELAKSGSVPCTRIETGTFIMMFIMSKGISLAEFVETYDMIDNVPRKKARACFAEFRKRGGKVRWLKDGSDGQRATAVFTWEGESTEISYSIDEAKRQGIVKPNSNWVKVPDNMLRARVLTKALGMLAPEILAGTDDYGDDSSLTPAPRFNLGTAKKDQTADGLPIIDISTSTTPEMPTPKPETPSSKPETPSSKTETPSSKTEEPISLEPGASEEPIPPPDSLEPEGAEPPSKPKFQIKPHPARKAELDEATIQQIGNILSGSYVKATNWMMHEGWIPQAPKKLNLETQAAEWLTRHIRTLSKANAKQILTKGLAFMSGPEEIQP